MRARAGFGRSAAKWGGPRHAGLAFAAALLLNVPAAAQNAPTPDPQAAAAPAAPPGDAPSVAILPFRVHSARPIEYLGESVANLFQEQLEASGRLRLADRDAVRRALPSGASPARDEALRDTAGSLGVDYVVSGSLTELAGRYSLDVRLTPAEVGRRPQTQVLTAQSDDELLKGVGELSERIVEHVVGAEPARVAQVDLLAPPELEPLLRARLNTRVGESYDPRVVRQDIETLSADPEVGSAEADTEEGPDGIIVRFRVLPSLRRISAPLDVEGASVAEVRVRGNRRIEAAAVRARLTTTPGQAYQPTRIARDVRQIYALGFFRDVRVLTDRDSRGVIVIFEVEENPVVRQISISGNDSIDGDKIRDVLTLTTGTTLDYPLLFENTARIKAVYRAQGYYLAEVDHDVESLSETSVGIHFIVDENDKLRLRKIEFVGNEAFSDRELREDFRTKPWRFWSYATTWFDKSGTYSEPLFLQDLRNVEKLYTDAGYLKVDISPPEVSASPDGIEVTVDIVENERFRVGKIDISGDETADVVALRKLLELREGEYFNRTFLTEDVNRLKNHYTDRGFFYANVEPLSQLGQGSQIVDVTFLVRKGPLYFIRQIDIAGNTTTVDPVIRRQIPLVEGQLYSQRQIALSRARVQGLGFFEEVDLRVEPTADPEQLDLEMTVVEKPTGSFSFGAGFSSQDSFLLNGSLSQANLFGRGYAVTANADIGKDTQRFFFSFRDPAFLGSEFSLGTTIFSTRVRFESFDQDATGADIVLGHRLSEDGRANGFLRYSFATREIQRDRNVNAASVIFREVFQNETTTSLAGLGFSADRRNDRLTPTDGYLLSGTAEFAGLGFFSKFLRLEGRFQKYIPAPRWIFEESTFVIGTRIGYTLPLNEITDFDFPTVTAIDDAVASASRQVTALSNIDTDLHLPLSERYFLGGIGQFQLRGFRARSVGPRRPILTRTGVNGTVFTPRNRVGDPLAGIPIGECIAPTGRCNDLNDKKYGDFDVPEQTDVIGGNKFVSTSLEYRFPISESFGLQGIGFFDTGNAFEEGDNLFDLTDWRMGAGGAVQWFSPFGPIMLVLGFPLDRRSEVEDSPIFEFSVGGG